MALHGNYDVGRDGDDDDDDVNYPAALPRRDQGPPYSIDNNQGGNFNRDLIFRRYYPVLEQVMVWREVEESESSAGGPWWCNPDFPHGGHNGHRIQLITDQPELHYEREHVDYEATSMSVELFVPLCCDNCESRVTQYLNDSPGVESVISNQWEKKVVVVGRNLQPHDLLQSLRRHLHMPRSSFWEHRPR